MADRVLITGGAGFIGTQVARRLLEAGHAVRILDSLVPQVHGTEPKLPDWLTRDCDVRWVDIRDRAAVEKAVVGVEAVLHLAAETGTGQSMYSIKRHVDVTVGGTATLLEALVPQASTIRRLMLASSRAVYGEGPYQCPRCGRVWPAARNPADLAQASWEVRCPDCGGTPEPVPADADGRTSPVSVYGAAKVAQEQLVSIFGTAYGVSTATLRFQNVYGSGQSLSNPYTGILTHFLSALRRGEAPRLFEDGLQTRDLVNIRDVGEAIVTTLGGVTDGTYDIGSGERLTIKEIAQRLAAAAGLSIAPVVTGEYRVGDVRHCAADIKHAAGAFGYAPSITLDAGLRAFVDWAASQPVGSGATEANDELSVHGLLGRALPPPNAGA